MSRCCANRTLFIGQNSSPPRFAEGGDFSRHSVKCWDKFYVEMRDLIFKYCEVIKPEC